MEKECLLCHNRQNIAKIIGCVENGFDTIYMQKRRRIMNWMEGMSEAINYIEEHLTEELAIEDIAAKAYVSSFYFQKAFRLLCGCTIGEYIRQRRLTQAGSVVASTKEKIIDIAITYGYDSPDSFTKAFTRFHGHTPTAVRKGGATIKSFAPLKIKFTLEGGFLMDYKMVEKDAFTVIGVAKEFDMETSFRKIPEFWVEHRQSKQGASICGRYGVCLDAKEKGNIFAYLIADEYDGQSVVPEGCETVTIPSNTWAVFPCVGPLPAALQDVNEKIFSEWLPNCREYEIAGNYNIEYYADAAKYEKGTADEAYYSEIWIPVKRR